MANPVEEHKALAVNRKASHDYFIEETIEAGIVLTGTEIKSIRLGKANLRDSFARISGGEAYLHNMHISPYEQGNRFNVDPTRARKLLMKRGQLAKLIGQTKERGYSLVPLKLYIRNGYCKVLVGLAKGKKNYDKREATAKRDAERDMQRALKDRQR